MQCKTTYTCRNIIARRLLCHCDVQTVCLHKYVTTRPPIVPKFDVSFPENLLKIVATSGEIFSLKFIKYVRLAAEPARGAKALPKPPTCNKGAYF